MTTTDTTLDTGALRKAGTDVHGPPDHAAEELLRLNPSYFARVLDFAAHAWRRGPLEKLAAAGRPIDMERALTERQEQIKAEFTAKRGYWNEFWDGFLRVDAEFFATYTALSSHPWEHGSVKPKVKEFIYCAFDASATHMFALGLRQHVANAIATARPPRS
jgi:hypothetical protein